MIDCAAMKSAKRKEPATSDEYRERFEKFGKALMAVPKKELDRELAKDERKKETRRKKNLASVVSQKYLYNMVRGE